MSYILLELVKGYWYLEADLLKSWNIDCRHFALERIKILIKVTSMPLAVCVVP